jgi:TolB-like protein
VTAELKAVFLSYASEDSEAAKRIAGALRAAGIEVWFDQSELRGGDAWDRKIRDQIHECRLFIPVISANTARRDEGYFRREWALASDRTRDIAHTRTFLVPVAIDATPERGASVPEKFQEVQWTRLPGGETPPAFAERIKQLLRPEDCPVLLAGTTIGPKLVPSVSRSPVSKYIAWGAGAIAIGAIGYFVAVKLWISPRRGSAPSANAAVVAGGLVAPIVPEKSIAVLPFADMSEQHDQEYFSDGLSEELIDRLAQSDDLRVIARTSSFYFKNKQATVAEIAKTLNVSHVLEGSVRKDGNLVRITTQLVRSSDGSNVWSRTYDRNLVDILRVQDEIAGTVALALKAALATTAPAQQTEAASQAYNLILEGHFFFRRHEMGDPQHATDLYRQAMQLDPNSARARIAFAEAILHLADHNLVPADTAAREAKEAAQAALTIDPTFASAHRLIAKIERDVNWNWTGALAELEQARSLPSSASDRRDVMLAIEYIRALRSGVYSERYENLLRDELAADPLSDTTQLAAVLTADNRFEEAYSLRYRSLQLSPNAMGAKAQLGLQLMYLKRYEDALAVAKTELNDFWRFSALACIHWAMAEHAESDQDLAEFAKEGPGSHHAYVMATVHAFRGERDEAFKWLDRSFHEHGAYVPELNVDPMLKSLRGDPRFRDLQLKLRLAK